MKSTRASTDALRMVKMDSFAAARPATLSGGQQQRVALARALVNRPLLLLLDEPLSALDANLRKEMQSELKSLQREVGITFLFVTHDQEEAMALSDRIALLRNGALEQIASPREIYSHPATAYTAQFIGQTNLLRAEVRGGIATCGSLQWPTAAARRHGAFLAAPRSDSACRRRHAASTPRRTCDSRAIDQTTTLWRRQRTPGNGLRRARLLRVKIPARGPLTGEQDFVFSAADAVRVSE